MSRFLPLFLVLLASEAPAHDSGLSRQPELQGVDLFTRPGETREILHDH